MFVVRYVALVALSLWLGDVLLLAGGAAPAAVRSLQLVGYLCGALVLVSLFIIKFVGPPPRAFTVRAGLVLVLLVLSAYAGEFRESPRWLATVNVALAMLLLAWYARE
jgi:hypothetical protein